MDTLREIDKIAYVRFASVYRDSRMRRPSSRAQEPHAAQANLNRPNTTYFLRWHELWAGLYPAHRFSTGADRAV